MIRVWVVPPEHISAVWLYAEPYIAKAVDRVGNRLDTADVWESLVKHDYQLWMVTEGESVLASFVTHIQQHPKTRGINTPYLGGDEHSMHLWFNQALAAIEDFGRANGCTIGEFCGRPGWKKWMEPEGYKAIMTIFEKEI